MKCVGDSYVTGGTDFFPCFKVIKEVVTQKAKHGSEFVIIFFTDGQGRWSEDAIDELNAMFKKL